MIGQLSHVEQEKILRGQMYGHLGVCENDEAYVVPILFAYDNGIVYCHTYEGKKADFIRKNPRVCFQVETVEGLRQWRSVIAWGICEELHGKDALHAIDVLSKKVGFLLRRGGKHLVKRGIQKSHLFRQDARSVLFYRILLKKMTGRFERS